MIGKLRGRIDELSADHAILDVGGVGYQLFCSSRTLASMGIDDHTMLWVETHVREDHIHLYGFASPAERQAFRVICQVQGVGAKLGLAILSLLSPGDIARAIAAGDSTSFTRVSGVGPKLGTRIVAELKDRLTGFGFDGPTLASTQPAPAAAAKTGRGKSSAAPLSSQPNPLDDALEALVGLGYGRAEAMQALARVQRDMPELQSPEALIPKALKELSL
jgi:Holliday junction DNA helicase RuvA